MDVIDIPLNEYLKKGILFKQSWKLFSTSVDWPEQEVFDPYVMGLWLGDGRVDRPEIHCPDWEAIEHLLTADFRDLTAKLFTPDERCRYVAITGIAGRENWFTSLLRTFYVNGEKRIPSVYLINSYKQRMELLAGLLDTDGYLNKTIYEITTQYKGLADDIEFLGRSLGFRVTRKTKQVKYDGKWRPYERLHICGDIAKIPLRIERKKAAQKGVFFRESTSTGFAVNAAGKGEYYGFTLTGDGRFLLGDFTVTHNTGSLASLLLAGYHVRVIDLDNGVDVIEGVPAIKAAKADYTEAGSGWRLTLRNSAALDVQTCTDGSIQMKKEALVGGKRVDGIQRVPDGTAWDKALSMFHHWPEFGPVETWGSDTVLVIDSMSFLGQAAMNWVMKLNGRLGAKPFDTDYGDAQALLRGVLGTLFATDLKCNVIVITHLDYRGGSLFKEGADRPNRPAPRPDHNDLGVEKAYPMTLGKAMNNTVGRYFNTLFLVKTVGSGESTRRVICTRNTSIGTAQIDLASIDLDTPPQLDIATGLAEYFERVKGKLPPRETK